MKYAVVQSGNKQYKVSEGDTIAVEKLTDIKPNQAYFFPKVLLFVDEAQRKVGMPAVGDVEVAATVIGEVKGIKIRVAKFKAKSRYRRVRGFRAMQTQLKIEKITVKGKAKAEK